MGLSPKTLGKLVKCCYGTRDAGAMWEACCVEALVSLGFLQGRASPCCLWHPSLKISLVVHGDDGPAAGKDASLNACWQTIMQHVEVELRGRLGVEDGDSREMKVLNRIVRVTPQGLS